MKKLALYILLMIVTSFANAQEKGSDSLRKNALNIYIDCSYGCDMSYIRKEITFVNYVRDNKDADLHILITTMETGSGGTEFTLFFTGQKSYARMSDTLKYSSNANSTSDEIRKLLVQTLKLGLVRYVARTPVANEINVSLNTTEGEEKTIEDRWKSWVFSISSNLYLNGQKSYNSLSVSGSLSATRITPGWKIRFSIYTNYSQQKFDLSPDILMIYSRSYSFYHLLVKSLSDHWSVGGSFYAQNSTYSNYKLNTWLTPAIEYDVFPYSQSTRRQLRLFYKIGPEYDIYNDTTIFNKTKELLFFQRFSASCDIIQKWGSISTSIYASNYLHDFSKYNISFYASLRIRIIKGLSFDLYGQYALIHDQLSLPKGGATTDEILLQQRLLETSYSYYLSAGLSYTFGSIYNNVVNPRFGE